MLESAKDAVHQAATSPKVKMLIQTLMAMDYNTHIITDSLSMHARNFN